MVHQFLSASSDVETALEVSLAVRVLQSFDVEHVVTYRDMLVPCYRVRETCFLQVVFAELARENQTLYGLTI